MNTKKIDKPDKAVVPLRFDALEYCEGFACAYFNKPYIKLRMFGNNTIDLANDKLIHTNSGEIVTRIEIDIDTDPIEWWEK